MDDCSKISASSAPAGSEEKTKVAAASDPLRDSARTEPEKKEVPAAENPETAAQLRQSKNFAALATMFLFPEQKSTAEDPQLQKCYAAIAGHREGDLVTLALPGGGEIAIRVTRAILDIVLARNLLRVGRQENPYWLFVLLNFITLGAYAVRNPDEAARWRVNDKFVEFLRKIDGEYGTAIDQSAAMRAFVTMHVFEAAGGASRMGMDRLIPGNIGRELEMAKVMAGAIGALAEGDPPNRAQYLIIAECIAINMSCEKTRRTRLPSFGSEKYQRLNAPVFTFLSALPDEFRHDAFLLLKNVHGWSLYNFLPEYSDRVLEEIKNFPAKTQRLFFEGAKSTSRGGLVAIFSSDSPSLKFKKNYLELYNSVFSEAERKEELEAKIPQQEYSCFRDSGSPGGWRWVTRDRSQAKDSLFVNTMAKKEKEIIQKEFEKLGIARIQDVREEHDGCRVKNTYGYVWIPVKGSKSESRFAMVRTLLKRKTTYPNAPDLEKKFSNPPEKEDGPSPAGKSSKKKVRSPLPEENSQGERSPKGEDEISAASAEGGG
ncbi:MAG: hypothetical protein LBB14_03640 [Puniceicoccales bacterium]|jgi:hypothetical protein|nr:hypothetical protein [Puniceicoccales bacterium]